MLLMINRQNLGLNPQHLLLMENFVTIRSTSDATRLTFSDAVGESFTAFIENAHFSGRVVVSTYISGPPSLLFEEMAREWRGWKGEKEWVDLDDNLRLTATTDLTGHTSLHVIMRDYSCSTDWRLQATLILEAGQLAEMARAMKKIFAHIQTA